MATSDVLLTYAWCRSSYTALRSLHRLGLRVAVADSSFSGMGQGSRLKSCKLRYRPFLQDPTGFVDDVVRLLQETGATFLLPGHDETEILARNRHRLPPNVILPVADADKIALANDKERTANLAESLGISVPLRLAWQTPQELRQKIAGVQLPWVVKLRRGNSAKGVFYPPSSDAALDLCVHLCDQYQLTPERFPIVQQRVEGEGWGVSCLYWEGERLASFTHRRLREKTATGGTSTLRISASNPLLEDYAWRLLDALGWHGLAMVEFKYHPASGQGWFIEINPRLWGSISLAVASGIDFPALLYQAATDGTSAVRQMVKPVRQGVLARWYLGDCIAALGELKHVRILRMLKMLVPGGADTYDDWFSDDPGAFTGEMAYYLVNFLRYRSLNPEQKGMVG